jgi:hypothetical protein
MQTVRKTRTVQPNDHGHETITVTETCPEAGWTVTSRTEIIERFDDGVLLIRLNVTSRGAGDYYAYPGRSSVRLEIDLARDDVPSPIEGAANAALLLAHIDDALAAVERFGYCGTGAPGPFLKQTHGHGALPVRA